MLHDSTAFVRARQRGGATDQAKHSNEQQGKSHWSVSEKEIVHLLFVVFANPEPADAVGT